MDKDVFNGHEVLPGDAQHCSAGGNDLPDYEAGAFTDAWGALESGIFGDLIDGFGVGDSLDEEDMVSPHESSEALIHSALRNLSISRKGRLGTGTAMVEEFDDVGEQIAYLLIQERVRNCFVDAAGKKAHKEGIEWVFTPMPDKYGRTFRECCEVLRVRPWLLQTRIHFQYFRKGVVFTEEMPLETVRMPDVMSGEANFYGGDDGVIVTNMAWLKPGIEHRAVATTVRAVNAIYKLEEKGILSEYGGCWYATGRNPFLMEKARRSVSWSSLWPRNAVS